MNMLIFAAGIFIVAIMFFQFMESNSINSSAFYLIQGHKTKIESQLNSDGLCSIKDAVFAEKLGLGSGSSSLYYKIDFSSEKFGADNKLVISFLDKTRNPKNPVLIASQQIITDATIILVDGNFIETSTPITTQMVGKDKISLDPSGKEVYTLDSYVIIKEVLDGEKYLYIIPCSTQVNNSCKQSIIKMGCYLLWKEGHDGSEDPNEQAPSCFNVYLPVNSDSLTTPTLTRRECRDDESLWPSSVV